MIEYLTFYKLYNFLTLHLYYFIVRRHLKKYNLSINGNARCIILLYGVEFAKKQKPFYVSLYFAHSPRLR